MIASTAMLYGSIVYAPWAYACLAKKFPRSRTMKVYRMDRMMEWRRNQIRMRWLERVFAVAGWTLGVPVLVAFVSWVWRVCAFVVAM